MTLYKIFDISIYELGSDISNIRFYSKKIPKNGFQPNIILETLLENNLNTINHHFTQFNDDLMNPLVDKRGLLGIINVTN